jgi:hypothetical protein
LDYTEKVDKMVYKGKWGSWYSWSEETNISIPNGYFVSGVEMRFEDKVSGDNTAANAIRLRTTNNWGTDGSPGWVKSAS